MRIKLYSSLLVVIFTALITTTAVGQAQGGPPGSMGQGEAIVISLQTSPFLNAEPACVGVQVGINLLMDIGVGPADSVTLFPTLQGVDVVSPRMDLTPETAPVELFCTTQSGPVLLTNLVRNFVDMGGNIVVCPLCWNTRYPGETPLFGVVGDGLAVHQLFLSADKVIDF